MPIKDLPDLVAFMLASPALVIFCMWMKNDTDLTTAALAALMLIVYWEGLLPMLIMALGWSKAVAKTCLRVCSETYRQERLSSVGQDHSDQRTFDDARSYVNHVKRRFATHPEVYHRFLDLMRDWNAGAMGLSGLSRRISTLFAGHPELIQGFHRFVPNTARIKRGVENDQNMEDLHQQDIAYQTRFMQQQMNERIAAIERQLQASIIREQRLRLTCEGAFAMAFAMWTQLPNALVDEAVGNSLFEIREKSVADHSQANARLDQIEASMDSFQEAVETKANTRSAKLDRVETSLHDGQEAAKHSMADLHAECIAEHSEISACIDQFKTSLNTLNEAVEWQSSRAFTTRARMHRIEINLDILCGHVNGSLSAIREEADRDRDASIHDIQHVDQPLHQGLKAVTDAQQKTADAVELLRSELKSDVQRMETFLRESQDALKAECCAYGAGIQKQIDLIAKIADVGGSKIWIEVDKRIHDAIAAEL